MLARTSSFTLTGLALCVLVATRASGQARIEVGPFVALYAPVGGFQPAPYYSTALPNSPGDLTGPAVGGQGRMWLGPRFGLQLQVAWAFSRAGGGNTPAGTRASTPATVLTSSAQALVRVSSSQRSQLWFSAGAGLVRHGGQAYARYGSPIQLATVLGFGSAIPLGKRLQADLGLTTFLYNIDVSDSTGTSLEHGFQVDPLLHVGFSVR